MEEKICSTCTRKFIPSSRHKDCPICRAHKRKRECVDCGTSVSYKAERCPTCSGKRLSGENAPKWSGGRSLTSKGYVSVYSPDHPRAHNNRVLEHILIMEESLGRSLLEGENVHHKNGDRADNRAENLELWVTMQPTGQRPEDLVQYAREIIARYGDIV